MRPLRIGRFYVSARFFDSLTPDEGTNLFHRMIVLRAELDRCSYRTEYMAYHPDFRISEDHAFIPEYRAVFSKDSVYPVWELVT
jgi:hypothetical protein